MPQTPLNSHPGIVKVDYQEGDYASQLLAMKVFSLTSCPTDKIQDFKEGELIARIEGTTPGPKAYSSVQVSKDKHIEVSACDGLRLTLVELGFALHESFLCADRHSRCYKDGSSRC
jgi:hypothetical protein